MNAIVDPIYGPISVSVPEPSTKIVIERVLAFPNGSGSYRIRHEGFILGVWTISILGHIVSDFRTGRTWTCGKAGIDDILREFFAFNKIDYDAIRAEVTWP